jgi:hypothetical protein
VKQIMASAAIWAGRDEAVFSVSNIGVLLLQAARKIPRAMRQSFGDDEVDSDAGRRRRLMAEASVCSGVVDDDARGLQGSGRTNKQGMNPDTIAETFFPVCVTPYR